MAALGIGALIWFTLINHKNDIKQVTVNDSYFTAQINEQTNKEIVKGSSFDDIMHSYNTMMQEVDDAAYLQNIDAEEAQNCRKILVYGYAPKLTEYAQKCFKSSEWNVKVIDTLKYEADNLIKTGILNSDSRDLPKLRDIKKIVDDYHAAVAATKVEGITSVAAAQNAISKAQSYMRAPLTNCRSLASALEAVPEKAKNSLAQNISAACHHRNASIDVLLKRIYEFEEAFHDYSRLASEKRMLEEARENAREQNVRNKMNTDRENIDEEIE